MKIKYLLTALGLLTLNIHSQQIEPSQFFPAHVGNIWIYDTEYTSYKTEIFRDSTDNNNNIFLFYSPSNDPSKPGKMIDTLFNVFQIHSAIDTILYNLYKLGAEKGESWTVVKEDTSGGRNRMDARVDSVYETLIFGEVRTVKEIGQYNIPFGDSVISEFGYLGKELLVSGIGEYMTWDVHQGPTKSLRGCIINGDTLGIITSNKDKVITISEFSLSQNYPNPFNPSTEIKYTIKNTGFVSLKVYDLLGKEIAVLVNEEKPTGSYTVSFNGSDLSSGVYFYVLKAEDFIESRKVVLLK